MSNDTLVDSIRKRYLQVLDRIADAAKTSGRLSDSVHLVVVSKSQPLDLIQAAISAGMNCFGENYAEEAAVKIAALKETGVEWHMIGHVQSRKAAIVAENFSMLHSLDGIKLAERLDRFCNQDGTVLQVLLEFNVGGESSKSGFTAWDPAHWVDFMPEIEQILALPHLHVRGLMTMPPYFEDAELARPFFIQLRKLRDFLRQQFPASEWDELSMGTSADYPVAIQEGSTYVRIGQAILGPRVK